MYSILDNIMKIIVIPQRIFIFHLPIHVKMKITVVSRSGKKIADLDPLNPNNTVADVQRELQIASMLFLFLCKYVRLVFFSLFLC